VHGVDDLDASAVVDDGGWRVDLTHRDGRRWSVSVQEDESAQLRPESCGKPAAAIRALRPGPLRQIA
jgi:hypothetical protein